MKPTHYHLAIIGSGPAGYTAAIYASRASLAPVLFEGHQPGGQLTITTEIENYPGFEHGIPGPALMESMRAQALRFGADIRSETVKVLSAEGRPFRIETDTSVCTADAVILATGASAKWLGIGKDVTLSRNGGGVSACATCDGFFFRGKEVAVVGGGDTALEEATYLTRFASKVNLIHRRDAFRASRAMQERAMADPKIAIHWNKVVADLVTTTRTTALGEAVERISALVLEDTIDGLRSELPVDGLFVAIGHQPNTRLVQDLVTLDEQGYVKTELGSSRTGVPGLFAAGDVADPIYRQAITAAASGCRAAVDVERWLQE